MTSTHRGPAGTSRRGFLVGAGVAVLGAGAGVAVGLLVDRTPDEVDAAQPDTLLAAVAGERALLAAVDAALAAGPSSTALLRQVRADHAAHLAALTAAARLAAGGASPSAAPRTPPAPAAPSRDALRAAEAAAASTAAKRALSLAGRDAALLASISACEATHAALLS